MAEHLTIMSCPRCGAATRRDTNFCQTCGNDLRGTGAGTIEGQTGPASSPASPSLFFPGDRDVLVTALRQTLGERYRYEGEVGKGGFAYVYRFFDTALDRDTAVKLLRPDLGDGTEVVDRFIREAKTAARLNHPNIVSIHDIGESSRLNYFVMEFVDGQTLTRYLRQNGKMSLKSSVRIGRDVLSAIAYAHRMGVVHRDLKPDNIMLRETGKPVVMDFGIAMAQGLSRITTEGSYVGTAPYMSPEQGKGDQVDARSDIYSMGVVLYEMLCGTLPFHGENPTAIIFQHVFKAPPRLREHDSAIPEGIEEVVLRALAKKPEERYQTGDDMARDLVVALRDVRTGTGPAFRDRETSAPARPSEEGRTLSREELEAYRPDSTGGGPAVAQRPQVAMAGVPEAAPAETSQAAAPHFPPRGTAQTEPLLQRAPAPSATAVIVAAAAAGAVLVALVLLLVLWPRLPWSSEGSPTPASGTEVTAGASPAPPPVPDALALGALVVTASPWADVEVDGRIIGRAEPTLRHSLSPGTYRVTLRHTELGSETREIAVQSGIDLRFEHVFDKTAPLRITVQPAADLVLDDQVLAANVTEYIATRVAPGRHTVTADASGFVKETKVVEIVPGVAADLRFSLQLEKKGVPAPTRSAPSPTAMRAPPSVPTPAPAAAATTGTLKVNVQPWAEVWIDGANAGVTPKPSGFSVAAGNHRVRLRNPPLNAQWDTRVDIKPGKTVELSFNFLLGRLAIRATPAATLVVTDLRPGTNRGKATDHGLVEQKTLELPIGRYEIALTTPHGKSWKGEVEVLSARTVELPRILE
ncbi:MAG: protein kinase [Candidatus Schekmanbacteria bacterium]|nr:protein kinase [Candidatus Schekmanbacteria bacterium]